MLRLNLNYQQIKHRKNHNFQIKNIFHSLLRILTFVIYSNKLLNTMFNMKLYFFEYHI